MVIPDDERRVVAAAASDDSEACENTVSEAEIDEALEGSFPASDPLQWTLGVDPHCHPQAEANKVEHEGGTES